MRAPELLVKRLNSREKETAQMGVVAFSALMFVSAFAVAGFNFRYGWSHIPTWLIIVAAAVQLASYGLYAEVMRENAYLSRTVEVQENQTVVDTGLYRIICHPMYSTTILLYLAMPIVLGSWVSFLIMLFYPVIIVFRIRNADGGNGSFGNYNPSFPVVETSGGALVCGSCNFASAEQIENMLCPALRLYLPMEAPCCSTLRMKSCFSYGELEKHRFFIYDC